MDLKNMQNINGTPLDETKNRLAMALAMRSMKPIDLANATGIPKSSISQYLSGYAVPKSDRIYLIANALNVSEAWLIGFDVTANKEKTTSEDYTNQDKYLIGIMHQLDERDQKTVITLAQSLLSE